ncbi:sigma-70 family RNA polymerase sigma factor [Rhodococcus rhodochrous]|uniref:sigma-70 family RNA polymerase sigma factor n=1 Tax=Rhodococcus rhodochrous TaxID=1829 RepID=UPI0024B9D77E|nr:sigma-70 family RNA polymerase sigma factor [Rhodococcus rhodochrous]MDJ0397494.1 sigma-70 family RNA polymerase sigma factor [Rhodococcus rhodochrous]
MDLIDDFEAARPRLLALAHRILGSFEDAEDVVQTAWLRTQSMDRTRIDNPGGWFTTVVGRLCVDHVRSRERRGEVPLLSDAIPDERLAAEEELLRREDVSRALLVLLGRLTTTQRVAYVMHDLFRIPFDEIADVLDTTTTNAKKLASRARRRLEAVEPTFAEEAARTSGHWQIVDAFLAAARGGDIDTLVALMAPDVVRAADPGLLPEGGAVEVIGNRAVAEETRFFTTRIRASIPMHVNGALAAVIAPGGHPLAAITFGFEYDKITRLEIARLKPTDEVSARRPGTAPEMMG